MNILREIRRTSNKSMPARLISIMIFCVIFIVTTYAWFSSQKDVKLTGGLEGEVTSWDVSYYVNDDENEILDQTATFVIDELYPGMDTTEDIVHIYNMGTSSTSIEYKLISVKIFGEEVLPQLKNNGDFQESGNTTNIFSKDENYPFNVSFTYDRNYLRGKYVDDATTPNATATFRIGASWDYSGTIAKDDLDTQFGKDAYAYYQQEGSDSTKAIEIQVKITSSMIHPSIEANSETE